MSVRQIQDELDRYGTRLPGSWIPVAYAEGGNLVLLASDERVFFWDHELEDRQPLFALAADFPRFLSDLRPFDPASTELRPGQVQSAWIDPDLLRDE